MQAVSMEAYQINGGPHDGLQNVARTGRGQFVCLPTHKGWHRYRWVSGGMYWQHVGMEGNGSMLPVRGGPLDGLTFSEPAIPYHFVCPMLDPEDSLGGCVMHKYVLDPKARVWRYTGVPA